MKLPGASEVPAVPRPPRAAGSTVSFFVPGTPIPKGSAKAFYNKHMGRAQVLQDNRDKQKPWASLISVTAQEAFDGSIWTGPLGLSLVFVMPRLKGHFGTGKRFATLKDSAPLHHVSKPDLDKLIRCVKDALTGIVWEDDSQVCYLSDTSKIYGDRPGVHVRVWRLVAQGDVP